MDCRVAMLLAMTGGGRGCDKTWTSSLKNLNVIENFLRTKQAHVIANAAQQSIGFRPLYPGGHNIFHSVTMLLAMVEENEFAIKHGQAR